MISELTADYVVIGAGSAGCAVAARLSEDPRNQVLLLEAGGSDRSPIILAPAATDIYALGNPKWDWCFSAEPDSSRDGRKDFWPRGRVLGGSSSINGTIYIRGHAKDFDEWASQSAKCWSYQEVLPYFRKAENNDLGRSEYHGDQGPLSVQRLRYVHPLTRCFVKAAASSGLSLNDDLNGSSQDGVAIIQATQRRGWRHSAARAYLSRRRANLRVISRAHVTRINFEGVRASGVDFRCEERVYRAIARRETILSAGAIGSPQLLMLSGIGSASDLQPLGIKVIADRASVGSNLQEHAGAWMTYAVTIPTLNCERGLLRQSFRAAQWLLSGRGPATTPGAQAVAFLRSDAAQERPDIQVHFSPVGYEFLPDQVRLYDEPTVSVLPNVCRPRSRGHIRLRSSDPFSSPRIEMPLLGNAQDVRLLMEACQQIRRIMHCSPIREYVIAESAPSTNVSTDAEWEQYLRSAVVPCYHPIGTCRMGSDAKSVVDPSLCVRGVAALRVVDASIMPTIPSGNTNAASIMIGERAADFIKMAKGAP